MSAIPATNARSELYRLIHQVNQEAEPVTITSKRGNAVLIGEEDWRSIQETLYLSAIPGYVESVRQAEAEGLEGASPELEW